MAISALTEIANVIHEHFLHEKEKTIKMYAFQLLDM